MEKNIFWSFANKITEGNKSRSNVRTLHEDFFSSLMESRDHQKIYSSTIVIVTFKRNNLAISADYSLAWVYWWRNSLRLLKNWWL